MHLCGYKSHFTVTPPCLLIVIDFVVTREAGQRHQRQQAGFAFLVDEAERAKAFPKSPVQGTSITSQMHVAQQQQRPEWTGFALRMIGLQLRDSDYLTTVRKPYYLQLSQILVT